MAETIVKLKQVIRTMTMMIEESEKSALEKREEARKIMQEQKVGHREMARAVLLNAHGYDREKSQWFVMRENVERLKREIVSQQQTANAFSAFESANKVMEELAKEVNPRNVAKVITRLQRNMENNKNVSEILAMPMSEGEKLSDEQLDMELETLMAFPPEKGKEEEGQVPDRPLPAEIPENPKKGGEKTAIAL